MKIGNYYKAIESTSFGAFTVSFNEGCSRCSLSTPNRLPILYRGNPEADIMLIGEAPGQQEERDEKPFTGPAGQLLDRIMNSIGLDTNRDMILSNVCYCRPAAPEGSGKQNYTPKQEQLNRCFPFVKKMIELVDPKVIVACGRTALAQLTETPTVKISPFEGKWLSSKYNNKIPIFVMIHPAAILHMGRDIERQKEMKAKVWNYMQYFRDTWKGKAVNKCQQ